MLYHLPFLHSLEGLLFDEAELPDEPEPLEPDEPVDLPAPDPEDDAVEPVFEEDVEIGSTVLE